MNMSQPEVLNPIWDAYNYIRAKNCRLSKLEKSQRLWEHADLHHDFTTANRDVNLFTAIKAWGRWAEEIYGK